MSGPVRKTTIVSAAIGIVGLGLAVYAYSAWREYRNYTVIAEGVVSQRTATVCCVRLKADIPGGSSNSEYSYRLISGTRSDTPPADGPKFHLGDKVQLVHPPGLPHRARLKDGFAPAVPPWVGWLGVAGVVVAAGLLLLAHCSTQAKDAT